MLFPWISHKILFPTIHNKEWKNKKNIYPRVYVVSAWSTCKPDKTFKISDFRIPIRGVTIHRCIAYRDLHVWRCAYRMKKQNCLNIAMQYILNLRCIDTACQISRIAIPYLLLKTRKQNTRTGSKCLILKKS